MSEIGGDAAAGTLLVLPVLREVMSFLLMRPFLPDVGPEDFCGAVPGRAHVLMEKWHRLLLKSLVPISAMQPGDMVLWHPDVVHAVQATNEGLADAAVMYIASMPKTAINDEYVVQQTIRYELGQPPPDFSHLGSGT